MGLWGYCCGRLYSIHSDTLFQCRSILSGGFLPSLGDNYMNKIKFKALWDSYPGTPPCDSSLSNQCAIKVGSALAKQGVNTTKLVPIKRHCWFHGNNEGHILSAEELAAGLKKVKISGIENAIELPGQDYKSKIAGKKGIIFFQNYWVRSQDNPGYPTGDHIDLWNGSRLTDWSSWIRIQFGVVIPDVWSDFEKSPKILFWRIPQ